MTIFKASRPSPLASIAYTMRHQSEVSKPNGDQIESLLLPRCTTVTRDEPHMLRMTKEPRLLARGSKKRGKQARPLASITKAIRHQSEVRKPNEDQHKEAA